MAKHRSHSIQFKRQVAQEFISGETLHGLAQRHDISRNLIRIWVRKYEEGAFDDEAQAADLIQEYEARIAALERLVGKQALELEFLKAALRSAPRPRSGTTSVFGQPHLDGETWIVVCEHAALLGREPFGPCQGRDRAAVACCNRQQMMKDRVLGLIEHQDGHLHSGHNHSHARRVLGALALRGHS
jgi:transposase-like protein